MEKSYGGVAASGIAGIDEIIFAPKPKKAQVPVCNKTVITEISEDFTLPDYQPEIRRLLRVIPAIPVPSRYIGGNLAEFSGNVCWSVLYVGNDGSVCGVKLSSVYEASSEFDPDAEAEPDSDFEAYDSITPESVVGRVTAPRKLNLRCRLNHHIRAYGEHRTEADIYGDAAPHSIKKLTRTLPFVRINGGIDDSVELEDSFPLAENSKLIDTQASVTVNDASADDGGIVCRGTVALRLMYRNGNGEPVTVDRKLPFTANAAAELDGGGWNCCAYGRITDISAEMNGAEANCRVRVCVTAQAQKNLPVQFTADIFSTENECEKSMASTSVPCSLLCGCYSFTHDGSSVIEGLPEGAKVLDAVCTAEPERIAPEKGRYIMTGKCRYNVLFGADGEYSARETELPFRCELGAGAETPHDWCADISVASCRVRPEGENMAFSAEMTAAVRICGNSAIDAVREASFGPELDRRRAAFTVAYTADGDTLWDIAKRYTADPDMLAESNGIKAVDPASPESLAGVRYLII